MIPVEQRNLWRPDDHPDGPQRGDCAAACIASIFEMPYEECADIDGTTTSIAAWLRTRFPGASPLTRILVKPEDERRIGDHERWPTHHHERGYWMATIWSSRIPDRVMTGCGCVERVAGGDPECEWCHGRPEERQHGIAWGLHAVVMCNAEVVWDPHPERDPSATVYFHSTTTWLVTDPAKLIARCSRGACGEGLVDGCYHRKAA